MTVRVYSDQAGTTAAAANDNIGKVEDLSKFDSDGVSSTTGPYLSVDANGFGSADILAQGGDVVQTFTNAIADGSALVVGTSKCIFFSNVNVEAGGTLTIGPAGDMINTNGLNLIGKVVSVATTTKVLTTAEQNSIATFFAERGASSVVVNDETVYDVNSVEADVVLDFTGDSFYRNVPHYFKLGGTYSTFADAFTGNSPKLTYSTAAGSNSTMVNSAGNIVWAPHNLLDYSEDFSNAAWGKFGGGVIVADAATSPDGTSNASQFYGSDGAHVIEDINATAGTTYTYSVFVKTNGTADLTVAINYRAGGSSINYFGVDIDAATGAVSAPALGLQSTSSNVQDVGNGWFRLSISHEAPATTTLARVYMANRTGSAASSSDGYLIYGAHVYRSDLGGMAQVPGAATGFETYVPTNGSAEYLPRVGHHVYNGSAWVNEGLLIESEARSNLFNHSEAITGTDVGNGTSALDGATAQGANAYQISLSTSTIDTGATQGFYLYGSLGTGEHAFSVLLKAGQYTDIRIRRGNGSVDTTTIGTVNLSTGVATNVDGELTVEPQGNGWYRVSWTDNVNNASATGFAVKPNSTTHGTSNGTDYFLLSQPQIEAAPTPSSYMPTNGGTYTRTAQSLEVPAHWYDVDNPTYTGPELVTDFSTYASDADFFADGYVRSDAVKVTFDPVNDTLDITDATNVRIDGHVSFVEGVTYQVSFTNDGPNFVSFQDNFSDFNQSFSTGTSTFVFTKGSGANVRVVVGAGATASISNLSIRQVSAPQFGWNSEAVSIQMDGRMTYADEDVSEQLVFTRWQESGTNYIRSGLTTAGGTTGRVDFRQNSVVEDSVLSGGSYHTPGVLVPFNIASRHGSTFINGAADGVALTEDTTPTALPDLSGTNLEIAQDFMGTIGTFRQFAGDIGDAGLVTATKPSTEPTLSLTFDGTNGSFYNLNWSE